LSDVCLAACLYNCRIVTVTVNIKGVNIKEQGLEQNKCDRKY